MMIVPTSRGYPKWRSVSALLSSLIPFVAFGDASAGAKSVEPKNLRWAVYYGAEALPEVFDPYDLVVLESFGHPPLQPLRDRKKILLGYVSVGEINSGRPYYSEFAGQDLLISENSNWPGSYSIDIRDPRWTKKLIEELIPAILHDGFDGIFLDTLDNQPHLERQDPEKYAGMTPAAAKLVRIIRQNYPQIKIMVNRAYEILPEIGGQIDYVLGESVYAGYDFTSKKPRQVSRDDYEHQIKFLSELKKRFPKLQIMSLDYWDPADTKGVTTIYSMQRANGFIPYVSTIELNRIIEEPSR
jgi:polysaccharide biosynthesis protein PelA